MSQDVASAPNAAVGRAYERLQSLLAEGDDAFVEEGPEVLQSAIEDPGFFDGVDTERAEPNSYTRKKVVGSPEGPVIRFMEWPPEYALLPHEHHGRPCFEVLVDGKLFLADLEPEPVGDDRYVLEETGHQVCEPGDAGVVDPRDGADVHAVYSPVRSRSLHVYPDDAHFSYGYVHVEDGDGDRDRYRREKFELDG